MKAKLESDVLEIGDIELHDRTDCSGGALENLLARIARRPGRWRRKMNHRDHFEDELLYYPDAA